MNRLYASSARRPSPAPRPIIGWPSRPATSTRSPGPSPRGVGAGQGAEAARPPRPPRRLDRGRGARPGPYEGPMPGHRRRVPAAGGPRAGAPDQPGAGQRRQDGRVSAPDRWRGTRSARLAARRAGRRHRGRPRRHAAHPGRQPGLRRPGRPRIRRAAALRPRSPLKIHLGSHQTRRPGSATGMSPRPTPGVLERRPRLRRHGDDPAALDRAALRRQVGHRAAGRPAGRARPIGAGDRPRLLAASVAAGRLRGGLAEAPCARA